MIYGLEPLVRAALDADDLVTYCEGDTGPDATGPAVWVTDNGGSMWTPTLDGRRRVIAARSMIVCVAADAISAAQLARDIATGLDGAHHAGGVLSVPLWTGALEDRSDPTAYCWSATVDVMLTTSR